MGSSIGKQLVKSPRVSEGAGRRGRATAVPAQTLAQAAHVHQDVPSDLTLRVKALESLLVEKGLVDPAALDALVDTMEHKVGPRNGARVVARAWVDPAYKKRLLENAPGRDRRARLHQRAGRAHGRRGKRTQGAQPDRLHAVLLLSVAGSRASAGLVQVRALSLARRHRPARHPARVRDAAGGRRRSARLGQHGGVALSRVCRSVRPAPRR